MRTVAAIEDSEALVSVLREDLMSYDKDGNSTDVTSGTKFVDFLESLNGDREMVADIIDGLLDEIKSMRAEFSKEIEKLQRHRHDTTKAYSGRPEM